MTNEVPEPVIQNGMTPIDFIYEYDKALGICNERLKSIRIYSGDQ